jgi:hypothetical protein
MPPPPYQESVLAQSIFADITVENDVLLAGGAGLSSVLYSGTTTTTSQGTQWIGTFTDPTSGLSEGSIAGSITTDPTFTIESGNVNFQGSGYTLSGSFSFDDTKGTGTLNFNLSNPFTGNQSWTGSNLTYTQNADGTWTFTGTITRKTALGAMTDTSMIINYTPGNPFVNNPTDTFTSSVLQKLPPGFVGPPAPVVVNRGKATTTSKASFDGEMEMEIDVTPEPSSLTLTLTGLLGLLGYARRRKLVAA